MYMLDLTTIIFLRHLALSWKILEMLVP